MPAFDSVTSKINSYTNLVGIYILKIAFYLTAVIIVYHHINWTAPVVGRKDLFGDARLFKSRDHRVWFTPLHCAVRKFDTRLARKCMKGHAEKKERNHFLFVGDSTVQNLFVSMVHVILPNYTVPDTALPLHAYIQDNSLAVVLEYRHASNINSSYLQYQNVIQNVTAPTLVIQGMGWMMETMLGLDLDAVSLGGVWIQLLPQLKALCRKTYCMWMSPDSIDVKPLSNLQRVKWFHNNKAYSAIAKHFLEKAGVIPWTSSSTISEFFLHQPVNLAGDFKAQVLLNWYCNVELKSPNGTCFTDVTPVTPKVSPLPVISVFIVFVAIIHGCVALYINHRYEISATDADQGKRISEIVKFIGYVVKLALIMAYFHFCDREDVKGKLKENKHYDPVKFFVPLAVVTLAGLSTLKKANDVVMLNRLQTEEWKGWMQLVILIYHITGASKVLPIYFCVRLLVTSYLFLNGYGQFTFFFLKGDFGIMRVLQTFIRLNLLVVLLCLVMDRPYQFYYFVPLVSFWYIVIYCTMFMWPRITVSVIDSSKSTKWLYGGIGIKLVLVAVIMTVLYFYEAGFNAIFANRVIGPLFILNYSVHEWAFRWQLDRYSVVCGMAFALVYQYLIRNQIMQETKDTSLFPDSITRIIRFSSLVALAGYLGFATLCRDKFGCNHVYPYIGILPVLGFVLLRNLHPSVRSTYSSFFAWFGKISLELFISQYHIWLADDTKKVLVLIPGYPLLNILTTSLIFVAVCCEIQEATAYFASYFITRKPPKPPVLPQS